MGASSFFIYMVEKEKSLNREESDFFLFLFRCNYSATFVESLAWW